MGEHLLEMVDFAFAIGLRGIDPIVDDPETVEFRINVDTTRHADTLDDPFDIARALRPGWLDLATVVFVQDRVIEEEVALVGSDDVGFDVVPDERRRDAFASQIAIDGVVAPLLGVVGEVGQRVVDLAGEQKLA